MLERIKETAAFIQARIENFQPEVGIILGTGLGDFAAHSPTSAPNGGCSGCFVSVVLRVASAPRRADLGGYCE